MRARFRPVLESVVIVFAITGGIARADEPPPPAGDGSDGPSAVERKLGACLASLERAERDHKEGKLVSARERYAVCSDNECPAKVRATCMRDREEVQRVLPTAAFAVRDARGRDIEARVTIGEQGSQGVLVPLGRSVPIDPGVHEVQWTAPSGEHGSQWVTIFEGEKGRIVLLTAASSPRETGEIPRDTKPSMRPLYVIGGGGLLIATAAVFQLVALSQDANRRSLDLAVAGGDWTSTSRAELAASRDSYSAAAHADQAIAITCASIGAFAIVTGVTWMFVRDRSARAAVKTAVGPKLAGAATAFSF